MDQLLHEVLTRANSVDRDEQEEAILQLAMILEKQSSLIKVDFYETVLPYYLISINLGPSEQEELVARLSELIDTEKRTPSMLWALGKAKASVGLIYLVNLLHKNSDNFDEEATWQALIALENFIVPRTMDSQMRDYLVHNNYIMSWLQRLTYTDNSRHKEIAQRLLKKVGILLNM